MDLAELGVSCGTLAQTDNSRIVGDCTILRKKIRAIQNLQPQAENDNSRL
jgi:hypothetical protein